MLASANGWEQCVQRLLQMGADRQLATSSGSTSLTIAARQGHSAVVKDLLQMVSSELEEEEAEAEDGGGGAAAAAYAYANLAEGSNVTALMRAAQGGFVKVGLGK